MVLLEAGEKSVKNTGVTDTLETNISPTWEEAT